MNDISRPIFGSASIARITPAWTTEADSGRPAICVSGKAWPAEQWRDVVSRWSAGESSDSLVVQFAPRGYTADDVRRLIVLLSASPFILPPVERAMFLLGGLVRRDSTASGGFRMGGQPASAKQLISQANKVLVATQLPTIKYPGTENSGAA